MNNQNKWTSRFYIYTKELAQFIEYCKRFECIQDTVITFTLDKEVVEEDSFIWKDGFVCDVTHYSQMDSIKFINVFSLFFHLSKYCMGV